MIAILLLLAIGGLMHAAGSFSDDGGTQGILLAFGFLLLSAYFTARVVSRFGLPKLTGYLLSGIIVGPSVLAMVGEPVLGELKIVSNTAVCLIALTAGSELNFIKLKPIGRVLRRILGYSVVGAMFALGAMLLAMSPFLPWLSSFGIGERLVICLMIGVALSAQSPSVTMALVSETRSEGPVTRVILAGVVVADLVVITGYAMASAAASSVLGGSVEVVTTVLIVCWELLGSIGFGVLVGMVIGTFLVRVGKGSSLFALLCCVVVAEIGQRIHLDPLIVMLAAGIWLENISKADSTKLLADVESAELPVFLVFFALAGAKIHLHTLYVAIIPVMILAATRAGAFYLGGRIATRGPEVPVAVKKYAWFGMVPQAGLALALALLIQRSFPAFGDQAAAILFGVVAINECIAPIVLRIVMLRTGEAGKRVGADFASGH